MISFDKKFIFIHHGKCGGSTIKREFLYLSRKYKFDTLYREKHKPLDFFIDLILSENQDPAEFYKFSIVRNPWDRAVSWYYHWHMVHREGQICVPFDRWLKTRGKNLRWQDLDKMDYVMKLEDIDADMSHVLEVLNIPQIKVTQHITHNTQRPTHKHYSEYYDDETQHIVGELYSDMIEKFQYTF